MAFHFAVATAGGILIGLASAAFLILNGRVAGISGIAAGLMRGPAAHWVSNLSFVLGLMLGPAIFRAFAGDWPAVHVGGSWLVLGSAGLLVGFGTRLGSGCTSGHGVCGMARLSPRSFAAVAVFLLTGMVTVFAMRILSL